MHSNLPDGLIDVTNIKHAKELMHDIVDNLQKKLEAGIELPIKFLPEINDKLFGLKRKTLVTIGGRPSNGKSVFCLQLARSLAESDLKVHFFSLEMTRESCVERLLADIMSVNSRDIQNGQVLNRKDFHQRMSQVNDILNKVQLTFSDSIGKNISEVEQVIKNMKGIDVVIIDYLQMCKGIGMQKREAIGEYVKRLRVLAIQKNVCIVLGSQINRGGGDGTMPTMNDLKSSGEIEEVSDQIIILHYPYFYSKDENEKGDYMIMVEKNRSGETFVKKCGFIPEYSRIVEVESWRKERESKPKPKPTVNKPDPKPAEVPEVQQFNRGFKTAHQISLSTT